MKYIELKNCYKTYPNGVTALADINLEISKGEFVFIIGPTGCGKSTLMKLLYREEKPTKGNVLVGGIKVEKLRNGKVYKLRKKLGIIFQNYRLLPKQTVYENVAFPLTMDGIKDSEIRPKVLKALERVGLKDKIKSFPDELSGGEQQRVCIARAIVNEPKLLLCDEPTGNLDPGVSKEIMDVIESINKKLGTTIIMVTHDAQIVNRMKKRVITINDGVISNDIMKGKYKANENN
ncbi:MAG: cell division ATP-binding protein FtsE [Bacilli bacterium]|nr:cell division ATP-binding protein FtsE [Bacilli bacterium]